MPSLLGWSDAQVRAVWLPVSENTVPISTLLGQLAGVGVNRVYVDVWNNGRAYYNSSAVRAFAGDEALGPDLLREATASAPAGLEVHAWLEYGLMACYGATTGNPFAEAAEQAGWIIGEHAGWQWMEPSKAAPLLHEMINEIAAGYGVPAQLDDHFACPAELPTCSSEKMDDASEEVAKASVRPSLSPAPLAFSRQNLNVDWAQWARDGRFTEYVPQLYTTDATAFASDLKATLAAVPASTTIVAGLRVDGSGSPTPWAAVEGMLNSADEQRVGVSVWYADGAVRLYPSQFRARWAKKTAANESMLGKIARYLF